MIQSDRKSEQGGRKFSEQPQKTAKPFCLPTPSKDKTPSLPLKSGTIGRLRLQKRIHTGEKKDIFQDNKLTFGEKDKFSFFIFA